MKISRTSVLSLAIASVLVIPACRYEGDPDLVSSVEGSSPPVGDQVSSQGGDFSFYSVKEEKESGSATSAIIDERNSFVTVSEEALLKFNLYRLSDGDQDVVVDIEIDYSKNLLTYVVMNSTTNEVKSTKTCALESNASDEVNNRVTFRINCNLDSSDGSRKFELEDVEYVGAFRPNGNKFGSTSLDYAVGAMGFNPKKNSLFIAGHAARTGFAEFPIPEVLSMATEVADVPVSDPPFREFIDLFSTGGNPEGINRYTGFFSHQGSLIINAEKWYDATASNKDTTLLVPDDSNLQSAIGYFELDCAAHCAGYMGKIPVELQSDFGGYQFYTGWSDIYSINKRYSIGPSLFAFNPDDVLKGSPETNPVITTEKFMDFPIADPISSAEAYLLPHSQVGGDKVGPFPAADSVWNLLSGAPYAFFVPGTRTFLAIGFTGGLEGGIGYKIYQKGATNPCPGYCPFLPEDQSNYFWAFDVDEILAAKAEGRKPQPYKYGKLNIPFDQGGKYLIKGGAFDDASKTLYIALQGGSAQVDRYDVRPMIVAYRFK